MKGKPILYMVDYFTRYTVGTVLKSKTPDEVVKAFMTHWVRYCQKPKKILTDNGSEFTGSVMMEAMSKLDIKVLTTAAYSPYSNRIYEKVHGLADGKQIILKSIYILRYLYQCKTYYQVSSGLESRP